MKKSPIMNPVQTCELRILEAQAMILIQLTYFLSLTQMNLKGRVLWWKVDIHCMNIIMIRPDHLHFVPRFRLKYPICKLSASHKDKLISIFCKRFLVHTVYYKRWEKRSDANGACNDQIASIICWYTAIVVLFHFL